MSPWLAGLGASPKVWSWLGAILAVLIAAGSCFGLGYSSGKEAGAVALDKYKSDVRERERDQELFLREQNENNRRKELTYEQKIADLRADFAQQQATAAARDARTIADLLNRTKRLRVPITSCAPAETNQVKLAAGGVDGAGTGELTPEASAALWSIAADGDRAIRKLTALQGWAVNAVLLCGGNKNDVVN